MSIKLGNLEFKPEDFISFNEIFIGDDSLTTLQMRAMAIANRLLRERLEKALEVFTPDIHHLVRREIHNVNVKWTSLSSPLTTHCARLVCIEEIKK